VSREGWSAEVSHPDSPQQLVAIAVSLAAYVVIVTDKIHRTIVALFGGFLIVALGIVSQEAAFTEDKRPEREANRDAGQ
jgi:Na+/H+ antiporter NhaD/arsenite permease-like protein